MTRATNGAVHVDDGSDDDELIVPSRRKHASDDEGSEADEPEGSFAGNGGRNDPGIVGSTQPEPRSSTHSRADPDDKDAADEAAKAQRRRLEPFEVPTAGAFYMHDDRFEEEVDLSTLKDKRSRKKSAADSERWVHDKFEELWLSEEKPDQGERHARGEGRGASRGRGRGRGRGRDMPARDVRPPVYAEDSRPGRPRRAAEPSPPNGGMVPPGFETHTPKKGEWNEKLKAAANRTTRPPNRPAENRQYSPPNRREPAEPQPYSKPNYDQNPLISTPRQPQTSHPEAQSDDDAPPGWTKAKGTTAGPATSFSSAPSQHTSPPGYSHDHAALQYGSSAEATQRAEHAANTQAWVATGQTRKSTTAPQQEQNQPSDTYPQSSSHQYQYHQFQQQYEQFHQQYQQYMQHQQQRQHAYQEYSQQALQQYMSQVSQMPAASTSQEQQPTPRSNGTQETTQNTTKPVINSKLNAAAVDFEPPSMKYNNSSGSLNKSSASTTAASAATASKQPSSNTQQSNQYPTADQPRPASSSAGVPSYPYGYDYAASAQGAVPPGYEGYSGYPSNYDYWVHLHQYMTAAAAAAATSSSSAAAAATGAQSSGSSAQAAAGAAPAAATAASTARAESPSPKPVTQAQGVSSSTPAAAAQPQGHGQSHAQGQGHGQSHAQGQGHGQPHAQGSGHGQSHGQGQGHGQSHAQGQGHGQSHAQGHGQGHGQSHGQSHGQRHGHAHPSYNAASAYPSVYGASAASGYDSSASVAPVALNSTKRPIPIKPPNASSHPGSADHHTESAAASKPRAGGRRYSAMAGNLAAS